MVEAAAKPKRNRVWTWVAVLIGLGVMVRIVDGAPSAKPQANPPTKTDTSIPGPLPESMGAQIVAPYLKDPASAQYQNLTYRTRHGLPVVCGEVNARNSFNGYTGFKDFVAVGKVVDIQGEVTTASFAKLWNGFCVDTDADDVKRHATHQHKHARG